jgi:ribonuclease HIII
MTVFTDVTKEDAAKLIKKGFQLVATKTIYEDLRMQKNGINLVLYTSGKLFVQGKDTEKIVELIESLHIGQQKKPEHFRKETGWLIGSDESLKGDTFGGIVVAGVKADDAMREKLLELGVADSKKLNDKEILRMAQKVKKIAPCTVISYLPDEYNRKDGNVTILLNDLHHKCGQDLGGGKHVVDKYPGCTVGSIRVEKAESKYVEVAAASILARANALEQIDYLSKLAGFEVPKGSTTVKLALSKLQEKGLDFDKFVKLHFKNVQKFMNEF